MLDFVKYCCRNTLDRGVEMESFIIAFISLLILLPVLYFLPLGFSVKGKVFIVVGSFFTGLFGLVASLFFPLWQTGLILLLFVISIAYLLNKRGGNWLYLEKVDEDLFSDIQEQPAVKTSEIKNTYTHIAFSDNMPKEEEAKGLVFSRKNKQNNLSLEKLVPENEWDLALFHKSADNKIDKEIEIPELEDYDSQNSHKGNSKISEQPKRIDQDVLESETDLESFLEEDFNPVRDKEYTDADTYEYMADLEKMLDIEELSLDELSPIKNEKASENITKQNEVRIELEELEELEEFEYQKHNEAEERTVKQ